MKQDEIIEMATQAGFHSWDEELQSPFVENANLFWLLEAFAKLVAAKEREALCIKMEEQNTWDLYDPASTAINVIRARGEA